MGEIRSRNSGLSVQDMEMLSAEIRAMSRRLSREQMLDVADLLHELIRERQFEARSWARLHERAGLEH